MLYSHIQYTYIHTWLMLLLLLLWDVDILHFTCFIKNVSVFTLTIVRYFWRPSDLFITVCLGILQPIKRPADIQVGSFYWPQYKIAMMEPIPKVAKKINLSGTVHPKIKIISSFTHPYASPNLHDFLSTVEHK